MANYLLDQATAKTTPQSQAIPGREREMTRNNAGGVVFSADAWTRLERFLILGSESGSYYVSESDLTAKNIDNVRQAIDQDGARAVQMIVDVSVGGRAPKNDPALYALALAASNSNSVTRSLALAALPKVARIGTHLFQFVAFIDKMRGWGPALRHAVADWYQSMPKSKLAYQLVKYQQRDGWSNRDLFRLAHIPANDAIGRWVTGRGYLPRVVARKLDKKLVVRAANYPGVEETDLPDIIKAFEMANGNGPCPLCAGHRKAGYQVTTCEGCMGSGIVKAEERDIISLINNYGLTREMIPTQFQKSPAVWEALLEKMPLGAMIRTLGRMSASGLLSPLSEASKTVCNRLADVELLRKARVHPIAVLKAMLVYGAGHGDKGSLSWTIVPQVIDALDAAYVKTFDLVEPTNKRFYLGVDVSGSMTCGAIAGFPGLTPNMGAAAMAMLIARTEPNYFIGGFSTEFVELGISRSDRLDAAMRKCQRNFGGTDTAIAINHAFVNKYPVDAFVVITDGETYAGNVHTCQALETYRQRTGLNSKLIVINMVANHTTITDPSDAGSLDVVGFDASVPTVINSFLGAAALAVEEAE